jgi:two-component system, NtrC family, response regulator AtoC
LRARGEDVVLLARHFAERFSREFKKPIASIDDAALARLRKHSWPGNVRELRNFIERAVLLCKGPTIGADDIVVGADERAWPCNLEQFTLPDDGFDLKKLAELETRLLRQALERTHNNQVRAAQLLHVSRDRLRYRLQKYGLVGE